MTNETMSNKKNITLSLTKGLIKDYKTFCEKNGMSVSKRIEILMNKDLMKNENKKN